MLSIVSFVLGFVVSGVSNPIKALVDACLQLLSVNNNYLSLKPENKGMYISYLVLLYISDVVTEAHLKRLILFWSLHITVYRSSNIIFISLERKFLLLGGKNQCNLR